MYIYTERQRERESLHREWVFRGSWLQHDILLLTHSSYREFASIIINQSPG